MILSTNPLTHVSKPATQEVTETATTNPGQEENFPPQEPRILLCFHCGQVCTSAWSLVQHFSQYHSQIYSASAIPPTSQALDSQKVALSETMELDSEKMECDTPVGCEVNKPAQNSEPLNRQHKMRLQKNTVSAFLKFLHSILTLITTIE